MDIGIHIGNKSINNKKGELPSALSKYEDSDFALQQRVSLVFYFSISAIIGLILIMLTTAYIQITDPRYGELYLPVFFSELVIIAIFIISLFLLMRGFHSFTANLLLVSSFLSVWFIMWVDKTDAITRLDSVVYIVAILSMMPLFITKHQRVILIYILVNIIVLFIFVRTCREQFSIPNSAVIDYLVDTSFAIILTGITGYISFVINRKSIDRAVSDINKRQEAQKALEKSENKFMEMADLLPQTVFEADLSGRLTYVNKSGFEIFGYSKEDFQNGINIFSAIIQEDQELAFENMKKLMDGETNKGYIYTALKKNKTTFPIQTYTSRILENQQPIGFRGIIIDITERKNAEIEIKKSRDRFESLVSNIPGVTYRCLYDKDWTMLFISSEITKLCGYPSSDFINNSVRTFNDVIYFDDRQNNLYVIDEAIQSGKAWEIEYRLKHSDGSIRWVNEKGRAVKNNIGRIDYLDGFISDITERKLAEAALTESELRYRNFFENAQIGIYQTSPEGKILKANPALIKMLGYESFEDIRERDLVKENVFVDKPRSFFKELIDKEGSISDFESQWRKKNGEIISVIENSRVVLDKKGNALYYEGFIENVTERKKAEKALRESEERYRTIISAFPDIIVITDQKGEIFFANEQLEKVTGINPNDFSNQNFAAYIHPDDLNIVKEAIQDLMLCENTYTGIIEYRMIDISGNNHWFSGIISKITLNDQILLQSILRDITEKKNIEKELLKHQNNLEQLVDERTEELKITNVELIETNKELNAQRLELEEVLNNLQSAQKQLIQAEKMASLGVLAAGVAHEINNPLNFINGGIQAINNYFVDNLSDHLENVNPLINAVNIGVIRAADIVKSLNRFSRQTESTSENCDIHSIIDNCLVMLSIQTKNRIDIIKQFTNDSFTIVANEGRLHQAVLNILSNAIQAIDDKGSITITTALLENELVLTISDSGLGIPKKNLSRIFDPFYTTKEPGKGTGLGLSISYEIIKGFNGSVEIQSEVKRGTNVIIKLPT